MLNQINFVPVKTEGYKETDMTVSVRCLQGIVPLGVLFSIFPRLMFS